MNFISPFLAQTPLGFFQEVLESLRTAFLEMVTGGTNLLPKLLGGLVILLVGWIVSRILQKILQVVGKKVGLDDLVGKDGIQKMLTSAGLTGGFTVVLSKAVFFGVLLYFIKSAADYTDLPMLRDPANGIINLLPKFITAGLISIVGYLFADLIRNLTRKSCERLNLEYGPTVSHLLFAFIMVLILIIAVGELGVDTKLIHDTVVIILAGLALAIGLALGLGLRPLAHAIVSGVYVRDQFKPGMELRIGDRSMTVVSVGPLNTRLEDGDEFLVISNSSLISDTVTGRDRS
jgi:small-conductance mechanosensitive channel